MVEFPVAGQQLRARMAAMTRACAMAILRLPPVTLRRRLLAMTFWVLPAELLRDHREDLTGSTVNGE